MLLAAAAPAAGVIGLLCVCRLPFTCAKIQSTCPIMSSTEPLRAQIAKVEAKSESASDISHISVAAAMPRAEFQIEQVHLTGCHWGELRLTDQELSALRRYLKALGVSAEVELEPCQSEEEEQEQGQPVVRAKPPVVIPVPRDYRTKRPLDEDTESTSCKKFRGVGSPSASDTTSTLTTPTPDSMSTCAEDTGSEASSWLQSPKVQQSPRAGDDHRVS